MSLNNHNAAMEVLKASMAAALPLRHVVRNLIDPGAEQRERLLAGVVCLVSEGGGEFANYRGREGDLGTMEVTLACFLLVEEATPPGAIEAAELALLGELLAWINAPTGLGDIDSVLPLSWTQSQQLEHPYGWLVLRLRVRN